MKRSKQEIIAQILEVCLESASKTRIVYQVNLNFRTINPYLEILVKNNLIEAGQGEQKLYRTTPKGVDLLETIKKVNDSLSRNLL
ncbi:MAG: winged helix-turn-helix domain-containing protein [Methanothrix sp.]|nr:winged helix-turn-helix domain-containing protein [Methanothrix sp.]